MYEIHEEKKFQNHVFVGWNFKTYLVHWYKLKCKSENNELLDYDFSGLAVFVA